MVINPTVPPLMLADPAPEDWRTLASCAQVDPDLWFAEQGDAASVRAAKRICARCPVQTRCLDVALQHPGMPGVWGGTSERERRGLRREKRTAA